MAQLDFHLAIDPILLILLVSQILGEGENTRPIPKIDLALMLRVKEFLLDRPTPAKLIGLIQLNTGMRISEPTLARLEDLVLDHEIPHLWVRKGIWWLFVLSHIE